MEKLNKEDIYLPLEGKSKEELTELYWLLKNNNQIMFRNELEDFLLYTDDKVSFLDFDSNDWGSSDLSVELNKQEVTINQLKEILQPMENKEEQLRKEAIERGFVNGVKFYCLNKKELVLIDNNIRFFCPDDMYDQGNYGLHVNGNYIFLNGKWGTLVEETLEQQLEKAKAEVKRLKKEINKIKVGDWVISSLNNCIFRYQYGRLEDDLTKITDQELINKLNNLIK